MARLVSLVLLGALVALGSGTTVTVSPVQKVIQLIDDMRAKVEADGKAADDEFAQYAKWCDDEAGDKTRAIKASQDDIAELKATIADAEGTIVALDTKIGELTTTISSTEAEASKAAANREAGHKDFMGAEDELVHTVDTLGHDYDLIKKEMSFIQGGKMPAGAQDKIQRMVAGLKSIVEAQWVSSVQKTEVAAFLQQRQAEQEGDTELQQPVAYESKSDGILGAISGMEEKAEESLSGERKEEMKDANSYQLLKMALGNELKNLKEELAKATSKKQFTTQELANANKALASSQRGLAEDSKSLAETKHECQTKAGEYEEEYKDRQNELGALGKAKEIMASKFSFLQTGTTVRVRTHTGSMMHQNEDRKERALQIIHTLGKNLGSTVLVSLSFRALADPFAKVKGMIEEMISKLLQEAAEEADQKAFCDTELGTTNKDMDQKQGKLDTVNARIEKATARSEELAEEVRVLSKELAESDAAVAEATRIRGEEKASFDKAAKDYSESQEACAAAIEVLRAYYESGSFVQVSATTRAASKMKAKDAGGIIGMLEVAESDFSRLLSEAKAAEQASSDEYDAMMQDNKVLKATKSAEVKSKRSEIASLGTTMENYGDDKDGLNKELGALGDYLDKLKPQCETQVPTYEERKARREKEIDGLKEALSVLEGDGVAF